MVSGALRAVCGAWFVFFGVVAVQKFLLDIPRSLRNSDRGSVRFVGYCAALLNWFRRSRVVPLSLVARLYWICQPYLRTHVMDLFSTLPPTGLYKEETNVEEFRVFLQSAKDVRIITSISSFNV